MKKNLLFFIPLIIITVVLFLLSITKMPIHIAVSVIGLLVLVAYTIVTKKTWKCVPLEIAQRVFYGIALVTGIVLKVQYIAALGIVHKISAVLFAVLLIITEVHKMIKK